MAQQKGARGVCGAFIQTQFQGPVAGSSMPSDMIDALGGWSTAGVGSRYGSGYNERLKYKWMLEITG